MVDNCKWKVPACCYSLCRLKFIKKNSCVGDTNSQKRTLAMISGHLRLLIRSNSIFLLHLPTCLKVYINIFKTCCGLRALLSSIGTLLRIILSNYYYCSHSYSCLHYSLSLAPYFVGDFEYYFVACLEYCLALYFEYCFVEL